MLVPDRKKKPMDHSLGGVTAFLDTGLSNMNLKISPYLKFVQKRGVV